MKLSSYFEDAAGAARSGAHAATFFVEVARQRHRLTRAVESLRSEDLARVLREFDRTYATHARDMGQIAGRTQMLRELTQAWLEAIERASKSVHEPPDVAALYAAAAADEDEDDREFYDASAAAVGRRWQD